MATRRQLLELGVTSGSIERRSNDGRLRALHAGVYLVGPIEPARAAEMAAVLAGGPRALLSHASALRLWQILPGAAPRPVHVSVPGSGRGGRPGIVFHRVGELADDERAIVDGIPVTAPGRTIADTARLLGSGELELALAVAEREGLIGSDELARLPDRYPRRPGMAVLRALLRQEGGPQLTRSVAERKCLSLLRDANLPLPHANVYVGPYELDLFYPDLDVAIEIDGRAHHSSRARFEADRRKDAWLRARGIEVIRLTWRQITSGATATAVQIGQALTMARMRRLKMRAPGGQPAATPPADPVADPLPRRRSLDAMSPGVTAGQGAGRKGAGSRR